MGAGDDQVLDKLNRCPGGDVSELMCVPLEGSWPSCAHLGWVPRTEQRALLCEPLVPHPLPGPARLISSLSGAQHPPPASTWRCSREAGIYKPQYGKAACFGAHGWSALFTDSNLGRAHCWALHVPYPLSGLPSSPEALPSPARPLGWVRPLVIHPSPQGSPDVSSLHSLISSRSDPLLFLNSNLLRAGHCVPSQCSAWSLTQNHLNE